MARNGGLNGVIGRVARLIPASVMRWLTLTLGYHIQTTNRFMLESSGMVYTACGYVANNRIEGDYAEFGVFSGRGIIEAFYSSRQFGLGGMRLWAFDSFEGLPGVQGRDSGGPFSTGEFACSRSDFERNLRRHRVDPGRVRVVEGRFDESLSPAAEACPELRSIAIAWIDCDLYESTVPVLDFLTDRLQDGAVVIFDDWHCFSGDPDRGEQRACSEWLERNPQIRLREYRSFHWAGKSFLVQRVDAAARIRATGS